jgi:hypothetical protein
VKQFRLQNLFLCVTLIAIGTALLVIPFELRWGFASESRELHFLAVIGLLAPGFFFGAGVGALFDCGFEGTIFGGALWLVLVGLMAFLR